MISREEVKKLAGLARIELTDKEVENLQKDMERILGYVSEIGRAEVPKGLAQEVPAHHNVFRDDSEPHGAGIFTEKLLQQTPKRKDDYVQVKKILGEA